MNLSIDTASTYTKGYTLEVQEFQHDEWKENPLAQKYRHIGYMCCLFSSRRQAVAYYNYWNDHMRSINKHGTYCSARDPETDRRYIVRKYFRETQSVAPFHIKDSPKIGVSRKRKHIVAVTTTYPSYDYLEQSKLPSI
jgi:hypothetical protein